MAKCRDSRPRLSPGRRPGARRAEWTVGAVVPKYSPSAHQKRKSIYPIQNLPRRIRSRFYLTRAYRIKSGHQSREYRRRCDRNIVRAQNQFDLWHKRSQAANGRSVRIQISFRPEEPDGRGIISVAREEQAVGAIDE